MPKLFFSGSGQKIGEVSQTQLAFLIEHLEEEDSGDRDYYIDKDTLEMLADLGCDEELLGQLKQALGDKSEMDISWSDD
jgi:hypothetical protein